MYSHYTVRPVQIEDARAINRLLDYKDRIHRHLDWRSPFDLIGEQPYLALESDFTLQAALACPQDPPGYAWIRFFGYSPNISLANAWKALFSAALRALSADRVQIISVAVQSWYLQLLLESKFSMHQTIVVLSLEAPAPVFPNHPEIRITPMIDAEIDQVRQVDNAAFEPIWRYAHNDLLSAYQNAAYATVARYKDRIVGYQISSATAFNAHLVRLAVLPELQGMQIGSSITADMVRYFSRSGIPTITVNTQSDNIASIKLYKRLGFTLTGERFPVLAYAP